MVHLRIPSIKAFIKYLAPKYGAVMPEDGPKEGKASLSKPKKKKITNAVSVLLLSISERLQERNDFEKLNGSNKCFILVKMYFPI